MKRDGDYLWGDCGTNKKVAVQLGGWEWTYAKQQRSGETAQKRVCSGPLCTHGKGH